MRRSHNICGVGTFFEGIMCYFTHFLKEGEESKYTIPPTDQTASCSRAVYSTDPDCSLVV